MQLIASFAEENGGINDEENCDPDGCVRSVDEHGFGPNCRDLREELRQAGARNKRYLITDFGAVGDGKR